MNVARSQSNIQFSADTVKLSLLEAEKTFIQKNLHLIAQKFDISIARSQVIQARLYDNPIFYYEQNAYNPLRHNFPLDISSSSQFQASFQQLIYLAGKRNKRTRLAELLVERSEQAFEELLRNLRYELRSTFFKIFFEQQKYRMYNDKIITVRDLVKKYENQAGKGNVPINEVTRLKALLFQLETERLNLADDLAEQQKYLALYLQNPPTIYTVPIVDTDRIDKILTTGLSFEGLLNTLVENRSDLKVQKLEVKLNENNFIYQKSLAVPDLRIGVTYDRFGSFAPNYLGFGVGMDLPLFSRNQGNIQSAKIQIEQSKKYLEIKEQTVQQELITGLRKLNLADSLMRTFDKPFVSDFEKLLSGIVNSYERRNIGLIEFLDYYQTYIESKTQMYDIQFNRMECIEYLNFIVAKPIFEY